MAAGGTALDPEVVTQLMGASRRTGRLGTLTARERDGLALMAEGRSNAAIAGARLASGGHWSGSLAPSFVGIGAESAELAPDPTGFSLCAAEPSLEDCPLVRLLALPGRGGCEDGAQQRGQHGLPLSAVEVRQPLAPLLANLDARRRGAPFPPSGHEAAIVSACEPGSGVGRNSLSDTP